MPAEPLPAERGADDPVVHDEILAASQMSELPDDVDVGELDEAQKRIYLLNKVRLRLSDYD